MLGRSCSSLFIICLSVFCLSSQTFGQPLPVTPELIKRAQSLTESQKADLARQLDISDATERKVTKPPTPAPKTSPPAIPNAEVKSAEVLKEASRRFGRSLFSRQVSTFAPTDDAPIPSTYRLGVGDEIEVQLVGKENEQLYLQIGRNGNINFPKVGTIALSGMTFESARDLLKERISRQFIGVDAIVSMGRLRAINVFMTGEVLVPGAYSVSALTTVTQALFQAGGVSDIGSLRKIQVRRGGETVATFDTYDLLLRGDNDGDIRLLSGDVIFVPPYDGLIEVEGEVKRPRVYELIGGETVGDVLSMAGSFTQDAYPGMTVLIRQSSSLGFPSVRTLDLRETEDSELDVRSGDHLNVPKASDTVANSVSIRGAVTRPGVYGWSENMHLSDLVSDPRRDLDKDVDLTFGLIARVKNELLDIEVLQFDLSSALQNPKGEEDPKLKEFDEVLIFSLAKGNKDNVRSASGRDALLGSILNKLAAQARDEAPLQTISISGSVRAPGVYPLVAGATIRDLLKLAGGVLDSAYLEVAELRRVVPYGSGQVVHEYTDIYLGDNSLAYDKKLMSRDHLSIREVVDWSRSDSVVVEGEVKFPGTYLFREGERLSDVIRRAGGTLDTASHDGVIFIRNSVAERERQRAGEMVREIRSTFASRLLTEEQTTQSLDEVNSLADTLLSFSGNGRLIIDFPSALAGVDGYDLELEDGDRIVIPKITNTIGVLGEVRQAGTHTFEKDLQVADYIELSGGHSVRADNKATYVVKANGSIQTFDSSLWRFSLDDASLDPGDTIVVPTNSHYKESLSVYREVTEVIYQSLVTIVALGSL